MDPYIKGNLCTDVLVNLGCVGRAVGQNRKFSLFKACQKWKASVAVTFGQCEPCVSCRYQNNLTGVLSSPFECLELHFNVGLSNLECSPKRKWSPSVPWTQTFNSWVQDILAIIFIPLHIWHTWLMLAKSYSSFKFFLLLAPLEKRELTDRS